MMTPATAATPRGRNMSSCSTLPPATKNMLNAVSTMTPVVPRSGSSRMSPDITATTKRNGSMPSRNEPTRFPRVLSQWARKMTSAILATSVGWNEGSPPMRSQRVAP